MSDPIKYNQEMCDLLRQKKIKQQFIAREAAQYPSAQTKHAVRERMKKIHGWNELLEKITRLKRPEQIAAGKIWQVYLDAKPDDLLFEGNKTACQKYIKETFGWRFYKKGMVRLGQVIYEPETEAT